ncbi:hypothetical protein AB0D99_10470 [Streptomyces sp. NPDC047971]|uniref:hypothetical protein n=1 Tax=Streptomyces sp. NPDC047971 TaxID=3154499 RepID=UPI0033D6C808
MKIRTDVADMLRAGHSDRAIAKTLHVCDKSVSAARAVLGLPKARPGHPPAESMESLFLARCKAVGDGHAEWTGHISNGGLGTFRWQGRHWSANRAAFEIHHNRPPVGYALPGCGHPHCVAPAHMQDRPMRAAAAHGQAARDVPPEDIAAMLLAGHSQSEIIRTLKIGAKTVRTVRQRLGVPVHKPGPAPMTIEESFRRRATPTSDGHLLWPSDDLRIATVDGASHSAARYSFRQKYGRNPVGNVLPGCGTPRCVHPDHVEDRPMREALDSQLTSIFGSAR